ncbi:hypothetical protein BDV96DRAFT_591592 [Lophiotrema nucula]|uniref:Uncharacterized protein n=1 Tax=Lophiotrema nucula TaxID=690887 RepID=A0A6A5YG75_9PLEO|nr:hypothetical protein BDV96DRAFT_591592 [Lophiotrema nucula]
MHACERIHPRLSGSLQPQSPFPRGRSLRPSSSLLDTCCSTVPRDHVDFVYPRWFIQLQLGSDCASWAATVQFSRGAKACRWRTTCSSRPRNTGPLQVGSAITGAVSRCVPSGGPVVRCVATPRFAPTSQSTGVCITAGRNRSDQSTNFGL